MNKDIKEFLDGFKREDHIVEFPIEIPEDVELSEYEGMPVLLNSVAKKFGPAIVSAGKVKPDNLPEGYFCLGFWGHGVNSYRIYFAKANDWENIYFEISYGGVYMDNKRAAENVKESFLKLAELENAVKEKTKKLFVFYRVGATFWKIELKNGKIKESGFRSRNAFDNLSQHFEDIKEFALS
ncbi:hypothetical protein HY837_05930 [archaeon]|nr:hypothetical protein [archaeon]